MITADQAKTFVRCLSVGGVAVFPADTVYGLACGADEPDALRRMYALKGRAPDKPAAVMFFAVGLALAALPELGPRTRDVLPRLLPGGVTLLLPNPQGRFAQPGVAEHEDPRAVPTLGLRVPALTDATVALAEMRWPILQTSANLAGGPDARRLVDVPEAIRDEADLLLDAGTLPGTPSTVIDLRAFEEDGTWSIVRAGAVPEATVAEALG